MDSKGVGSRPSDLVHDQSVLASFVSFLRLRLV